MGYLDARADVCRYHKAYMRDERMIKHYESEMDNATKMNQVEAEELEAGYQYNVSQATAAIDSQIATIQSAMQALDPTNTQDAAKIQQYKTQIDQLEKQKAARIAQYGVIKNTTSNRVSIAKDTWESKIKVQKEFWEGEKPKHKGLWDDAKRRVQEGLANLIPSAKSGSTQQT